MVGAGAELALLLIGGFRVMVEQVQDELARRGHPGIRPVHEFALRGVAEGARSSSELARRLAVSRQASAKTIGFLVERGYLEQAADDQDARRKVLVVTRRGTELLSTGQQLIDEVRARWASRIGDDELDAIQAHLRDLVSSSPTRFDTAGWLTGP